MTAELEGGEWSAARPGRTLPPGKDQVPNVHEAGWVPGPVWTGGKSRPYRDSIPDRPARSSVAIPTELPCPHIKIIYFYIPYALSSLSRNLFTQRGPKFPIIEEKALYLAILDADIYI